VASMSDAELGHQGSSVSPSAAISNALVHIQREYVGRGPTKARTSIRDDAVLVILRDTLTKAERSLIDAGNADQVLQMRHSFQRAMREEMVAAVEQITGRTVIAFMSDNHIDPDLASEVFVLQPPAPAGTSLDEDREAGRTAVR